MDNNLKSWTVIYKHSGTGEVVHAKEYAATEQEARRKARADGIIKEHGKGVDFWDVIDVLADE